VRILIANDDGIYSPGLIALAEVASKFGDVRIVAPAVEQSSKSMAITSSRPLDYRPTTLPSGFEAYRVNGTPADCVALGVFNWDKVDLVLSGINLGPNIGNAIWHSGTLAAAKQAALLGLRGIAFSTPVDDTDPNFDVVKVWAEKALRILLKHDHLPLVNVNIPQEPHGLAWTSQSFRHYDGQIVPGADPMGRKHFWFTVIPIEQVEPGSDRWALHEGLVSMTPLRLDLTDDQLLAEVAAKDPLDEEGKPAVRTSMASRKSGAV
jgi:5'-nucleotidase